MLSLNSSFLLLCNSVVWGLLVLLMGTAAMGIYCMGLLCFFVLFFFHHKIHPHCNHQFVTFLTHIWLSHHTWFSHRSTRSINSGPAFHSLFFCYGVKSFTLHQHFVSSYSWFLFSSAFTHCLCELFFPKLPFESILLYVYQKQMER